MLCTEIVSDTQKIFLYTTCHPQVLQKEELQTKIYLYYVNKLTQYKEKTHSDRTKEQQSSFPDVKSKALSLDIKTKKQQKRNVNARCQSV